MKKKVLFFVFLVILLLTSSLTFGWLFCPEKLRSFVYRELSYIVMTKNITHEAKTDLDKIKRILQYIHDHLQVPDGYPAVDKTVFNDFVRGVAWCDQQSWALAHLADKVGIQGSIVMLRGFQTRSSHTVAHLFLDGEYRIFDPLYGLIFWNRKKNNIATFDNISKFSRSLQSEKFNALKEYYPKFTENYFKFYDLKYPPEIWSDLSKKRPLSKKIIVGILKLNYKIMGDPYAHTFQDLYLKDHKQYYKARNYFLYNRYEKAEKAYLGVLADNQNTAKVDEVQYHLSTLYYDAGDYEQAEKMLQKMLREHPRTGWHSPALYYLGLTYEKLGKINLARKYYHMTRTNPTNDAALKLARTYNVN